MAQDERYAWCVLELPERPDCLKLNAIDSTGVRGGEHIGRKLTEAILANLKDRVSEITGRMR